jgi:membrane protease YdiL (CAAX protease family)
MNPFPAGDPAGPGRPARFPVGIAVGLYALLALAAVVWRGLADAEPVWRAPGAGTPGAGRLALHALAGAGVGLGVVVASRAWTRRSRAGRALARALAQALGPLPARSVWALALASGLAEEAFFRGALQPRTGWLAASLLFGLAHLVPRRDLAPWALFAVAAGGLFGALFEATGDLAAPVAAHVVVNGLNLRWLARGRSG